MHIHIYIYIYTLHTFYIYIHYIHIYTDTAHFCVHTYNICGEASALLYGQEQSF